MSYNIFFSHSGADKDWARWIAEAAKGVDIGVYLFEHDPQPGTQIAQKIKNAIQSSDALVVFLTAHGQSSAYVQQEIGFAEAHVKLIIPIVCVGTKRPSLAMLEGREYLLLDPANPQSALGTLVAWLQRLKAKKEATQAVLGFGALVVAAILFAGKSSS